MILGFKKKLPNGEPTGFKEKIGDGSKKHSLRKGRRWRKGMTIHMAYGVRTKQYEQFNEKECISTQWAFMTFDGHALEVTVSGRYLMPHEVSLLIENDGLTREEFIEWFFSESDEWSGQIIHWTNLKY